MFLAFAAAEGWRPAETLWRISRLDEIWQEEQWGEDADAAAAAEHKRQAFLHACVFFEIC